MADNGRILGQVDPPDATDTLLYSVPSGKRAVISTVFACNRNAAARTVRLRAARANESTVSVKQYIYFGVNVPANDTIALTAGLTLMAGESIYVYRSAADVNFSAFGVEIDA